MPETTTPDASSAVELGSIEREIHIDAPPAVVFEVVSRPEHIREWWSDDARPDPTTGAVGEISWTSKVSGEIQIVPITVIESDPPRRFAFRWVAEDGEAPTPANSLLVTFDLEPSPTGTRLRLTESGFREKGWEGAVLEEAYRDHTNGWNTFVPRLGSYAEKIAASS